MAEIGRWGGHVFTVSPQQVRSFSGLTISGTAETEETEEGGQKYTTRKISKPMEASLSVYLKARMGADVRGEAMAFVEEAQNGTTDYFYVSNKKLATCQLMLTSANVSDVRINYAGAWIEATVKLTLKQASKADGIVPGSSTSAGGSSGGGGGGGGGSYGGGGGGSYGGGSGSGTKVSVYNADPVDTSGSAASGAKIGAMFWGAPGAATGMAIGTLTEYGGKIVNSLKEQFQPTKATAPTKQTVSSAQDYLSQISSKSGKKATATKTYAGGRQME